jgi:hypothetical protein
MPSIPHRCITVPSSRAPHALAVKINLQFNDLQAILSSQLGFRSILEGCCPAIGIPQTTIHTMKQFIFSLALLALAPLAQAHTVMYYADLSGPAEAPPNASPGTGSAIVTLDLDLVTMKVEVTFSGLIGNVSAAHIHGPTSVAGAGTAGVMTMTPTFLGFPSGVTSGTYSQTFDMTLASSYNASFITNNGGTVSSALNAQIAALDAGKAYVNIHSTSFPGGEIRGFLTPVPEPGTAALGLVGGAILMRRRRSAQV